MLPTDEKVPIGSMVESRNGAEKSTSHQECPILFRL